MDNMSYAQVYCVERITDKEGNLSIQHTPEPKGKFEEGGSAYRAEQAMKMRDELNEKYQNNNRWYVAVTEEY
ncbi:hypothetical protein VP249E411_P0124 [Vibrio phage 249E41-1]|nr:hypothetical protein VP249E411_P0124 [Vibrio phage 249E41-1]CAH9017072.1 hypothetical protein VP193E371_P0122 [Vibrio phage 193E37-1]